MIVDLDLRIAGELRLDALQVLLGRGDALTRDVGRHARFLELGGGSELAVGEVLLALVVGLGIDLLAESRLDVLTLGAPLRAQAANLGALDLDVRFDLGERQPVRRIVEPVEKLAARDALVLADRDLDDRAAQFGGDIDAVALDVGVVGLDVAAGAQPEEQRRGAGEERQRPHEQTHENAAADARATRDSDRNRRCQRLGLLSIHCYIWSAGRPRPSTSGRAWLIMPAKRYSRPYRRPSPGGGWAGCAPSRNSL